MRGMRDECRRFFRAGLADVPKSRIVIIRNVNWSVDWWLLLMSEQVSRFMWMATG